MNLPPWDTYVKFTLLLTRAERAFGHGKFLEAQALLAEAGVMIQTEKGLEELSA